MARTSSPLRPLNPDGGAPLYEAVAKRVESLIEGGTLAPGARIPSVRRFAAQLGVSITTVLEAYRRLEDQGLVEARPQSGYYVRARPDALPLPDVSRCADEPRESRVGRLVLELNSDMARRDLVPLGAAIPAPEFFPTTRLNRALARALREHPEACQTYDSVRGCEPLRVQVARRLMEAGCRVTPDEIVTTPGAQSAVWLALRALTKPGDTVIVESPTYYGLLETLEALHLRALEVGTDPETGLCINHVESALEQNDVRAVVAVPNFGNPLGHMMTDEKKKALVDLLARHRVPLVEDDVYGELGFVEGRPKACKAWDREGQVLLCSSVSKTLAPGYRVGWIVPGAYQEDVERYKLAAQVATATAPQLAVADILESGGYDRHLRTLRRRYRELVRRVSHAVAESFPEGTRVTNPEGGHVLWVELPKSCDATELFHRALDAGVGVAPGRLFSPGDRFDHFVRLNCALPWTPEVETAIARLGELAAELAD